MILNFKEKKTNIFKNRPDVEQKLVQKFFNSLDSNEKNEEDVDRFFVDVGANDPVIDSQSYHLESLGWKPSRTIYDSIIEYKEWLDCASSIDNIIEYCSKKMEELNVLRDCNQWK